MIRDAEIREFVDSLAKADTPDDQSFNIYRECCSMCQSDTLAQHI